MKKIFILYILATLYINASAQNKTNYITVAYGDSVKLHIQNATGSIQWQTSADGTTWTNVQDVTDKEQIGFIPAVNAYYRAQITAVGCNLAFSDAVYVTTFKKSPDILNPEELSVLIKQCFISMRYWYGKENGYLLSENATDLFTWGRETVSGISAYQDIYKSKITESSAFVGLWNELYRGVMNCNAAVYFLQKSGLSSADKIENEAEVRFLRAFYLWHIVETWGGTVFVSGWEPITPGAAKIAPVDTFYNHIFSDLTFAEANLPDNVTSNTSLSKSAAKALLARMYLTRNDYTHAYEYATQIINSAKYALVADYSTLWDITKQQNPEIIYALDNSIFPDPLLSYQTSSGAIPANGGFQGHAIFNCSYDNMQGMMRSIKYGRPYLRYCPTRYLMELYNPQMDKRFDATFRTTWICNDTSRTIIKWPSQISVGGTMIPVDAAKIGKRMFSIGDTAFVLCPKVIPASQKALINGKYYHPVRGYQILDMNDMFDTIPLLNRSVYIPPMGKMGDPSRISISEMYSSRNSSLIRYAEICLIAAEAAFKLGNSMQAYTYFNLLATRSGGGSALLSSYGVNGPSDITMDFILDERARELVGEQLRWFDLKRTGKLMERVILHNPDYKYSIKNFHNLRPIPPAPLIKFGDITLQNPGY